MICVDDENPPLSELTCTTASLEPAAATVLAAVAAPAPTAAAAPAAAGHKVDPVAAVATYPVPNDPEDVACLRQIVNGDVGKPDNNRVSCSVESSATVIEIDDNDDVICTDPVTDSLENVKQAVARAWNDQSRERLKTVAAKALKEVDDVGSRGSKSASPSMSGTPPGGIRRVIGRITGIHPKVVTNQSNSTPLRLSSSDAVSASRSSSCKDSRKMITDESPNIVNVSRPARVSRPLSTTKRTRDILPAAGSLPPKLRDRDICKISSQIAASVMRTNARSAGNDDVIICDDETSQFPAAAAASRVPSSATAPSSLRINSCATRNESSKDVNVVSLDDADDVVVVSVTDLSPPKDAAVGRPAAGGRAERSDNYRVKMGGRDRTPESSLHACVNEIGHTTSKTIGGGAQHSVTASMTSDSSVIVLD